MDSVLEYNKRVLASLSPGDLVEFDRGLYNHWAVYIGNGDLIHLAESDDENFLEKLLQPGLMLVPTVGKKSDKAVVRKDHFMKVAGTSRAKKNNSNDSSFKFLPAEEMVKRAKAGLGKKGYNLLLNNCEHFATYCRYGKAESKQVQKVGNVVTGVVEALTPPPLLNMWDLVKGK